MVQLWPVSAHVPRTCTSPGVSTGRSLHWQWPLWTHFGSRLCGHGHVVAPSKSLKLDRAREGGGAMSQTEQLQVPSVTERTAVLWPHNCSNSAACGCSWGSTLFILSTGTSNREKLQSFPANTKERLKPVVDTCTVGECFGMATAVDGEDELGQAERWKGSQKDHGVIFKVMCGSHIQYRHDTSNVKCPETKTLHEIWAALLGVLPCLRLHPKPPRPTCQIREIIPEAGKCVLAETVIPAEGPDRDFWPQFIWAVFKPVQEQGCYIYPNNLNY